MRKKVYIGLTVLFSIFGLKIILVNSGSKFFLFWFALAVCCSILAYLNHYNVWDKLSNSVKRGILVVLCMGFAVFTALEGCIISGFFMQGQQNLDYIIVLGTWVKENKQPSLLLQDRLEKAYDYLMDNPDTICIVSGGQGDNEPVAEGQAMYNYLIEKGISEDRILVEDQSKDTRENMLFSGEMIDEKNCSVGIVSNNFHVFRAVQLARTIGYNNVCGIASKTSFGYLFNNMIRESLAIVKELIKGNIQICFCL